MRDPQRDDRGIPGIPLEAFKSCLRERRFFKDWKKQRLVLLRKGNKPLGVASAYRPICLVDTIGKLLEKLILQRRQALLVGENGVSENQFGFRKGRSTVDAIKVWLTSPQMQEKELVSIRDSVR